MHINETCYKTGRVSTRDFTVLKIEVTIHDLKEDAKDEDVESGVEDE